MILRSSKGVAARGAIANGRHEAAYGVGAYAAYLAVRALVWNDRGRERAVVNARRVLAAEQRVGIAVEQRVQAVATRVPSVASVLAAVYAGANVALNVGWLMSLRRRGAAHFRRERRASMIAFCSALPFFAAFPTAPPRALDGFHDTLAERGLPLDGAILVKCYNPIAAMPSHHVAFAMVTGLGLASQAGSRRRALAWRTYPAVVALVVMATANHFVADVAAGAALGALARRLALGRSGNHVVR